MAVPLEQAGAQLGREALLKSVSRFALPMVFHENLFQKAALFSNVKALSHS